MRWVGWGCRHAVIVEEGGALLALRMLMVKIKNGEGNREGKGQIERDDGLTSSYNLRSGHGSHRRWGKGCEYNMDMAECKKVVKSECM